MIEAGFGELVDRIPPDIEALKRLAKSHESQSLGLKLIVDKVISTKEGSYAVKAAIYNTIELYEKVLPKESWAKIAEKIRAQPESEVYTLLTASVEDGEPERLKRCEKSGKARTDAIVDS